MGIDAFLSEMSSWAGSSLTSFHLTYFSLSKTFVNFFMRNEYIYQCIIWKILHTKIPKKKQVTLMVSTVSTVLYRPKYGKPDSKSPEQTITNIIVIDHFGSLCICFSMNLVRSHNKIFSFLRVFQEIMSSFKWARKVKYTELAWERVLL